MIDSRAKGARGELKVRDMLRELTGLKWERIPGSGAYSTSHGLKGDVYVPGTTNVFTIEVKSYEEDHLSSKILHNKSNPLLGWWEQAQRQAIQNGNLPLLIFKYDRSKIFVAYPCGIWSNREVYNSILIKVDDYEFSVSLLEDFIKKEKPEFVK
jgi:hypothetical protein